MRHWPGKAPRTAQQDSDDEDDKPLLNALAKPEAPAIRPPVRDARVERLRQARRRWDADEADDDDIDAKRRRRRRIAEAEEVTEEFDDERKTVLERMKLERMMATEQMEDAEMEESDEQIANRRALLKARQQTQAQDDKELMARIEADEEDKDEESGSEYVEVQRHPSTPLICSTVPMPFQ